MNGEIRAAMDWLNARKRAAVGADYGEARLSRGDTEAKIRAMCSGFDLDVDELTTAAGIAVEVWATVCLNGEPPAAVVAAIFTEGFLMGMRVAGERDG